MHRPHHTRSTRVTPANEPELISFTPVEPGWVVTEPNHDWDIPAVNVYPIVGWALYKDYLTHETYLVPVDNHRTGTFEDGPVYHSRLLFRDAQGPLLTLSKAAFNAAVSDRVAL